MQTPSAKIYSKPGKRNNQVLVKITIVELSQAMDKFDSHRDVVLLKFQKAGFAVINFNELRYYYQPKYVVVEGIKGQSVLSL